MKVYFIPLYLLAIVLLIGCQRKASIKEIIENPRKYEGKRILIKGKVENTYSLFLIKYFELSDESGAKIRVITKRLLPKEGEVVSIQGKVKESFEIGNENITVFVEDD